MKKLITLLIVLICCVCTVGAQRVSTNAKIYIKNSVGWSKMYMYIFNAESVNNTWPGDEMTETETINGVTYFVKEFDPNIGAKIVLTNGSGSGNENQTTDWGNTSLDLFLDVSDSKTDEGKHIINRLEAWYLYNTDDHTYSLVNTSIGQDNFTVELDNLTSPRNFNFIIASTNAFNWKTTLDNNDYVYRPNGATDEELSFQVKSPVYTWKNQSSGHFSLVDTKPAVYVFKFASDTQYSYTAYFTRSIAASGYATYSSEYDAAIPEGVKAYCAPNLSEEKYVNLTKVTGGLSKNSGFLLTSTPGTEYKFYATNETLTAPASNLLQPSVTATNIAASTDENNYYFFASQPNGPGFYRIESATTSAAGKAYLATGNQALGAAPASGDTGSKPNWVVSDEVLDLTVESEVTAISNVTPVAQQPMREGVYTITGVRVAQPTKGIYIVNGKKVVVK